MKIEDIFCYKGNDIERMCWGEKLIKINNLLQKDLKQISYNNSFIVFGLPLIKNNLEELLKEIENVKYKIERIQFILFNKANVLLFVPYKNINYFLNSEPVLKKIEDVIVPSSIQIPHSHPPPPPPLQIPQFQQINKNVVKND